jgi:hypothetical protein
MGAAVSIVIIAILAVLCVVLVRRRDRMRQLLEQMENPTVRISVPPEELQGLPLAGTMGRRDRPGTLLLYASRGEDYIDVIGVSDSDGGIRFMAGYRPEELPKDIEDAMARGVPYGPQKGATLQPTLRKPRA